MRREPRSARSLLPPSQYLCHPRPIRRFELRLHPVGLDSPRHITHRAGPLRTPRNLATPRVKSPERLRPCLAGTGSGVRIPDAPPGLNWELALDHAECQVFGVWTTIFAAWTTIVTTCLT